MFAQLSLSLSLCLQLHLSRGQKQTWQFVNDPAGVAASAVSGAGTTNGDRGARADRGRLTMRPMTVYQVNFALLNPVGLPAENSKFWRNDFKFQ